MADATFPITVDPTTGYGFRNNILFPGTAAQATAGATRALAVINDRLPSGVTIAGLTALPR